MALDLASAATIITLPPNVNAPDVVTQYQAAFNGRTVVIPKGVGQIGAFSFDYQGDDTVEMDNEVTDHWLEDNTAVQDHIGVKPNIVTLRGFVSELALSSNLLLSINTALAAVQNGLQQTSAYLGTYTPGVQTSIEKAITQAQSVAVQIEQAAARAAQLASFFQTAPSMTKQQAAYFQLSSLRIARVVFTVATPFQVFDNMTIVSLRPTQPARTKTITDFTVRMKQLNFSNDISVPNFTTKYGGRAAQGNQPLTQNGGTAGTVGATVSTNIVSAFKKLTTN